MEPLARPEQAVGGRKATPLTGGKKIVPRVRAGASRRLSRAGRSAACEQPAAAQSSNTINLRARYLTVCLDAGDLLLNCLLALRRAMFQYSLISC